jgi:hypothetical protein
MMIESYHAGQVVRYHSNPRIARLGQSDGEHSWGVAIIIDQLHPDPSRDLLRAALRHDGGEMYAGDLSHPFKQANPEFAEQHRKIEAEAATAIGLRLPNLTPDEQDWLALADRLESILYVKLHMPWILQERSWVEGICNAMTQALYFNVHNTVGKLIND